MADEKITVRSAVRDISAGSIGGFVSVLSSHPIDVIKNRITAGKHGRGMYDCFIYILRNETVSGFWKGLSVPLASQVALNAIIFGVEGCARKLLPESKSNFDKVIHPMISGATAGLAQSFVCSPMELIKLRMQMQDIGTKRSQNFAGVLEQTRRIWSQGGIRGINKGLGVVMLRDSVGFAAYIAAYDVLQQRMADHFDTCVDKLSFLHLSIAGGSAGCISWAVNYPVERVRVQIQDDVDGRYRGIIDCTRKIIAEERLYGLFKGFVPCMARAFLCSCTLLPAMTYTKRHWLWTVD